MLTADLIANPIQNQVADPTVNLIAGPTVNRIAGLTVSLIADHTNRHRNKKNYQRKRKALFFDEYYSINDTINGYCIRKILGEGRYGIVYLAEDSSNEKYVIKQLKQEMLLQTREKIFYEEVILQSLDDPCFPKFISKFKDTTREGYILKYIDGIVMEDLLFENQYIFTKSEIYKICEQLLQMVQTLHNLNIVHRDIRLPNVILTKDQQLALIDFGLARFIDNNRYTKDMDYWYIGDFLIHLYYSSYIANDTEERPWFEELDLSNAERLFLKKLMGIEGSFHNIEEINELFDKIKI